MHLTQQVKAIATMRGYIEFAPEVVMAHASGLEHDANALTLPLYGVPFAIKDNIDVAAHPTTAACPAFSYTPDQSATVVQKLVAAGAMLIGKTNLDQFATGLVGTRSPYGPCSNPFDDRYIAGGSSSGSALAVALNLVSFALGTGYRRLRARPCGVQQHRWTKADSRCNEHSRCRAGVPHARLRIDFCEYLQRRLGRLQCRSRP